MASIGVTPPTASPSAPPLRESALLTDEPPKYSDVVTTTRQSRQTRNSQRVPSENTGLFQSTQPTTRRRQPREDNDDSGNKHFDMGRFVLCWTGLSTQASKLTCHLCCWWYMAVGAFGAAGATLPFAMFRPKDVSWNTTVWLDSSPTFMKGYILEYAAINHFILYEVAGAACLILMLMWCFTAAFFRFHHPQGEFHESKFRFKKSVNTCPIVGCFMFACFLFGSVTVAMVHNILGMCNLLTPPVDCFLFFPTGDYFMMYIIINTSAMTAVMFGFLCLNCLCYFTCVRPNAGNVCC